MDTAITLWDTFSPDLHREEKQRLVWPTHIAGSSQQPAKPSVTFFLDLFLQWDQEGVCLHGPVKPGGIQVCLAAAGCLTAQGLNGLIRDCRAPWDGAGVARRDFSCLRKTGPLPSSSSVHHFDLDFQPDVNNLGCGHSLDDKRALQTLLKCHAPHDGFPSLGIPSASPKHSSTQLSCRNHPSVLW